MPLREVPAEELSRLVDVSCQLSTISSSVAWEGRIVSVIEEEVSLGEGRPPVLRQWVKHPGAVAVVALRGEPGAEEILLERQYRHPVRAYLWEIPAGLLDIEGEDYLLAAQRELAEETDLQAARWDVLVDYFNSPGGYNESLRIFLARDVSPTGSIFERTDEESDMLAAWVDLDEALTGVLAGRFHNPSTVVGVMAAHAARGRGWADLRPADSPWFR